jgi:UDP-galactopyranose mutase
MLKDSILRSDDLHNLKFLVVGAGFFGSVMAERIAADRGDRVVVVEKRGHIGGNSYSEVDRATGIELHCYGSHIFHTSDEKVWSYINRFCTFNSYRHRVLTQFRDRIYQMPINLATLNHFYGANFTPSQAEMFVCAEAAKERMTEPSNFEEKAISLIGRKVYDAFIREYTLKQWGTDPRNLPEEILSRIPLRFSYKSDYFDDVWQGIPAEGYGKLFERILKHDKIEVYLNHDFFDIREHVSQDTCIVYSGPTDLFFGHKFGALGWRTSTFELERHPVADFQGAAVINYAESIIPYTRIHEFRHYHEERNYSRNATLIAKEYSKPAGIHDDPHYPINADRDKRLLSKYLQEAGRLTNVIFGGRLGNYKYLNMDQAVATALDTYDKYISARLER